jgi:hypothetical protein
MGGIFAEGIDLPGEQLVGVTVGTTRWQGQDLAENYCPGH